MRIEQHQELNTEAADALIGKFVSESPLWPDCAVGREVHPGFSPWRSLRAPLCALAPRQGDPHPATGDAPILTAISHTSS
jgi:hypothetical protein